MSQVERPVRSTPAGIWHLPADGGAGSLLRVRDGTSAGEVRQVRDLRVSGLLPIGDVVEEDGQVWLRTPQPIGPSLDELLDVRSGFGTDDALAVLTGVGRALETLHRHGAVHGEIDSRAVLFEVTGAPVLVTVALGAGPRQADLDGLADMAAVLAEAWCPAEGVAVLRRCAGIVEIAGIAAGLATLPSPRYPPTAALVEAAQSWVPAGGGIPAPRTAPDEEQSHTHRP